MAILLNFGQSVVLKKMIYVSDDAPEEIKKQVQDYKDNIEKLIELYMQNAIKSDRITINNELEKAGLKEAADLIRKF